MQSNKQGKQQQQQQQQQQAPKQVRPNATTSSNWRQATPNVSSPSNNAGITQAPANIQASNSMSSNIDDDQMMDEGFVAAKKYVERLYNAMKNHKAAEVRSLYYQQWTEITSNHFLEREWPSDEAISDFCDNDDLFLLCYKELYYRHIFVHGSPQLEHRFQSWSNYRSLFDRLLEPKESSSLLIPAEWLNDMIDEFIYQFQDFYMFRLEMTKRTEDDIQFLEGNQSMWKVTSVLHYLNSFVDKSGISKVLSQERSSKHSGLSALQSLGYFSIIGLCRVHTLLADYRLAVKILDPIDIDDRRAIFTQVTACHVTLLYHLGFCYMMMRRYIDALEIFSQVLLAHRTSKDRSVTFADDQMNKYERVMALAAMIIVLSPGVRVDEQARKLINEKYFEKLSLARSNTGNNSSNSNSVDQTKGFEELFTFASPKFISPAIPDFTAKVDQHREASQIQLTRFMNEVNIQLSLPTIRSYLKLYKSISIEKLASLCGMDSKNFREHLISINNRSVQVVRTKDGSSPIEGNQTIVSDIHFYISNDTVYVEEAAQTRTYGRYFVSQTLKFESILYDLNKKPTPSSTQAASASTNEESTQDE